MPLLLIVFTVENLTNSNVTMEVAYAYIWIFFSILTNMTSRTLNSLSFPRALLQLNRVLKINTNRSKYASHFLDVVKFKFPLKSIIIYLIEDHFNSTSI